ncbi:hypothetical protein [Actinoplanes sp. NPDC026619]|uniref:hypothetical protein n=1 Tax=Actinoplanes sp. NPDC026619 TaxID=3155798 RepID=UPI00340697A7
MSLELEHHLPAAMQHEADGVDFPAGLVARAARNHHHHQTKMRIGYALGAAGLAGALAAGLTITGGTQAPTVAGPPPATAQTPALRLAAAATASGDSSYRVKVTTDYSVYQGAFDPARKTGYLKAANEYGFLVQLLINGTKYEGTEPPADGKPPHSGGEKYSRYGQHPGTFDHLSIEGGDVENAAATPDPTALMKALREQNATITENADGTLHFEYTVTSDAGKSTSTTRGDVTLDAQKRIAKVATGFTWSSTVKGKLQSGKGKLIVELSDYGVPVQVQRPADVVPTK